ncbi:MAG TPA: ribulose-phosphate 3-epimerase [Anaerolineae bacterium]|nr:ribulose-phosphate 3-epimerase [Anaerolineae bacterium]HID85392.1 ribulose-phosphate 3-epimerase [Anaerolineales bacterium]HIQ09390.1 ribulose-phosphate 3-epimerase [Anaerolineaceae bacterium]
MTKQALLLAPSILSADFACLGEAIAEAERYGADWIHVDVMDGHFVPNLTIGPPVVAAIRRVTALPLDVHLMITPPEPMLKAFAEAGADYLTVHVEATPHIHRALQQIRALGCRPGVSLNPGTPASAIGPVLHLVDLVLVMSVNPGFGGQRFLPEVLPKVRRIRERLDEVNPEALVSIDGGINASTLPLAREAGAQVFVAGSAVFGHPEGVRGGLAALRGALTAEVR